MSESIPSAEIFTPSSAPADQLAFKAASIAGTRMTPLCDAPVAVDADVARFRLGDEHAGQRKARGRMRKLGIARLGRNWERDRGDDLAVLKRGREQALEEIVRSDRALVGLDGRAERQHRGRIVRGGVVVGDRAADRAAIAHRRSPSSEARCASAGIAFCTCAALRTTSKWVVAALIVSVSAEMSRCRPAP